MLIFLEAALPNGLKNLVVTFDETHLTHYGGLVLIQRFCKKLRLRRRLQRQIRFRQRTSAYHPADMILALRFAIIVGLRRMNKTEVLQYNGVFLLLLGIDHFPDPSSLRRFLARLTPSEIRQLVALHDQLRSTLFAVPRPRTSLTIDLDSVILVLYGRQAGSTVGYNPKKPGRRSYHPLLGFETHGQEFWHGSLRTGRMAAITGAVPFIRRCLAKAPATIARSRIRFRADAGFYSREVVEALDALGVRYAVVAKLYPTIKHLVTACEFVPIRDGWEAGEFSYQPFRWQKAHRFVVVRRPTPEDPEEAKQLTLFTFKNYAYHVIVTNLTTMPWRAWRFYARRARIEKTIRELIHDYPLAHIPTGDWVANVAFFQLVLLAYNLVHWFKRACLPKEYLGATIGTIRTQFLVVPAKLAKRGNRNLLHLPKDYHYRVEFSKALQRLERLKIPSGKRNL